MSQGDNRKIISGTIIITIISSIIATGLTTIANASTGVSSDVVSNWILNNGINILIMGGTSIGSILLALKVWVAGANERFNNIAADLRRMSTTAEGVCDKLQSLTAEYQATRSKMEVEMETMHERITTAIYNEKVLREHDIEYLSRRIDKLEGKQ